MRKFFSAVTVLALSALLMAPMALAAAGDPPVFDTSTLTPKINDYATALLAGAVILVGAVLIAIVPFVLLRMGVRYIKRWFGAGRAANPA